MDILRKISETVSLWFGRLTLVQKIVAGVLGVLLVGVMIFLGFAGKSVDRAVLYSSLSPVDSFEIQQKLDRMGVPYAVSSKGGVIRVPKSQVYTLRMELADEGLPRHHGAGFDIFDHPSLTTTDFVQHVQYLQALQSELDRTIEEMSPTLARQPEPNTSAAGRACQLASVSSSSAWQASVPVTSLDAPAPAPWRFKASADRLKTCGWLERSR